MKKTKKQQHDNETVIIGHHFGQRKYFGQKGYTWRIRHHKTRGQLYLKVGQLAWVNVTGQKNQALVIITDIKTVTELADRRQARRYKTVKKSVHILFGILIPKKWLNMNSLWPIKLLEDNLIQEMC